MTGRHAEVAGAGIGGLAAAIALADRGWSVRVHERHSSLRSQGFGVTIHSNGLRVLKALGVLDAAMRGANRVYRAESRDNHDRLLASVEFGAPSARISRATLVGALADRARALGVEIRVQSNVVSASPDGVLALEHGDTLRADLVVGADGVNSKVRESLPLLRSRKMLREGAQRMTIPRLPTDFPGDSAGTLTEWWSSTRRIIYGACSPTEIYVALITSTDDVAGCQSPIDVGSWSAMFPAQREIFERIRRDADWEHVLWVPLQVIKLHGWSTGRVAVLGDAAHAMTPNLAQGGGCALMNGLSLACTLAQQPADIASALLSWERRERPLTEHTQNWSTAYSAIAAWPRALREPTLSLLGRPFFMRSIRRASNHTPTGTEHLGQVGIAAGA